MVRAKFKVRSINRSMGSKPTVHEDGTKSWEPAEMWNVEMSPVYGNGDPNHENSKFWSATPGGTIQLNCVNRDAVEQFDLNKEFYVDFTLAE